MHHPVGYVYVDDENLRPVGNEMRVMLSDVDYLDTYKAMENLVVKGLTRSIGVSNFNSKQLEQILKVCKVRPVTNQVECNPGLNQKKLIKFCNDYDITVTAYAPLGGSNIKKIDSQFFVNNVIVCIGNKYKKTPAQVILRYLIDLGTIPIPKSVNKDRIEENINVFDFKLNDNDIEIMEYLNAENRLYQFSALRDHKYYPFNVDY